MPPDLYSSSTVLTNGVAKWIFSVHFSPVFCAALWEWNSRPEGKISIHIKLLFLFYIWTSCFSEVDPLILNWFFRIARLCEMLCRRTTYECTATPVRLETAFGVAGIIPSESSGKALLCSSTLLLQGALRTHSFLLTLHLNMPSI
jgi:hypothetical protein